MTRRYRHKESMGSILYDSFAPVVILCLLGLPLLYFTDRTAFWRWMFYIIAVVILLGIMILGLEKLWYDIKQKRLDSTLGCIKQNDLDGYITNYINSFGLEKKKGNVWEYRGYSFDWERLNDFRKVLNEKGMHLSLNDYKGVSEILHHYIQEKEERLTRDSISTVPKMLSSLPGSEFEILLYRLFESKGYSVHKTGKTGDQGGDLVVNMNDQRVLVQAKRYSGNVGNSAIQEAVAAQKFYNCNKAMAVTSSDFTVEAVELAKVNSVELMNGRLLREQLMQYLKENWS